MIEAKELRQGNWVINSDNEYQQVGVIRSVITKYNPIPLTSDILSKCGFKKYSYEPNYTLGDDFEKSEKCDEYTQGKLCIMDWGKGFILSNSFSFDLRVEIKTLHQLQNLYYALTQTELIVNL
jgi:hypothetical protein